MNITVENNIITIQDNTNYASGLHQQNIHKCGLTAVDNTIRNIIQVDINNNNNNNGHLYCAGIRQV